MKGKNNAFISPLYSSLPAALQTLLHRGAKQWMCTAAAKLKKRLKPNLPNNLLRLLLRLLL